MRGGNEAVVWLPWFLAKGPDNSKAEPLEATMRESHVSIANDLGLLPTLRAAPAVEHARPSPGSSMRQIN